MDEKRVDALESKPGLVVDECRAHDTLDEEGFPWNNGNTV